MAPFIRPISRDWLFFITVDFYIMFYVLRKEKRRLSINLAAFVKMINIKKNTDKYQI